MTWERRRWSRRRAIELAAATASSLALAPGLARASQHAPLDAEVGLDPGHSPIDVGASGAGVGEFEHTLDIGLRVRDILLLRGVSVNMSRTDHRALSPMTARDTTERTRIEQAARIQAVGNVRIYVSIHFNGGGPSFRGTETYYNAHNAGHQSFRLADALQRNLVTAIRGTGYPVLDRGVKEDLLAGKPYGHFFSLRGGMPSVLVEGLFLSNPAEAALLLRDDVRQAIAEGYAGGILEYLAGAAS
jgi:N-acetylmuramoyl-L-alanine amidase